MDSIKHEEGLGNDKSSGSPGGDAAGEGNAHLSAGDMKLGLSSPKTLADPEGHTQRSGRGRNASTHGSNLNSLALIKDSPTPLGVEVEGVLPATVATPVPTPAPAPATTTAATTTKRKRKSKATQQAEEQQQQADLQQQVDQQQQQQPLSKLPALEQPHRDAQQPRSRLPSMVDEQPAGADSAVKDLEHAMSKHLPSPSANQPSTDFSADALIKHQQHQVQQQQQQQLQHDPNEKSSTIQWIGAPYQQPAPMPATALLRQLYANRESVIRATARQTPTGVFYGEQQGGPLPTPPGSESSYENQYLQLHSAAAAASVTHPGGQKAPGGNSTDAFTNLVSTYGGYHSSIDYHNAMTPPSSVSPRDSNNSAKAPAAAAPPPGLLVGSNGGYDYADSLRGQYATPVDGGAPAASLPLKPQAYTAGMHPHATTTTEGGVTYSNLDQPQYFAPHSSFHLYHKGSPASAWYSTPS